MAGGPITHYPSTLDHTKDWKVIIETHDELFQTKDKTAVASPPPKLPPVCKPLDDESLEELRKKIVNTWNSLRPI